MRKPRVNQLRNARAQICSELGTGEKVASGMEYRGVEFSVVLGLGRKLWRWYATVNGVWLSGEASTQCAAVEKQLIERHRL